jgi:hypothetical protein
LANAATLQLAKDLRETLARPALTERQAKLYSQRLRKDMGREGLVSFAAGDVENYIDDAMLLLQCALIERKNSPESGWRNGVKRAAELLEWLSQSDLKPRGAPLHLLAAAAYQLAGYPAMALGHLKFVPGDEPHSVMLREFLRANFPSILSAVGAFWQSQYLLAEAGRVMPADLDLATIRQIVMCIGTVCTYLRTGEGDEPEPAIVKIELLSANLIHSRDPYSGLLATFWRKIIL